MLTPTARLGLLRPENIDEVRVDDLNFNSSTIDTATGYAVVSATAPTTPYTGMMWYDSTAKILKLWNGTTWVYSMDPTPVVALARCTALYNMNTTPHDVPGCVATVTHPRPNMKVVLTANFDFDVTVSGTSAAVGGFKIDGARVSSSQAIYANFGTGRATVCGQHFGTVAAAGSHEYRLEVYLTGGSGDCNVQTLTSLIVQVFN